jgi:hypothetical protein
MAASAAASVQPDALSGSQLSQQLQQMVDTLKQRKWLQTLRPLNTFVAPSMFSRPRSLTELTTRVELNVGFFLTNYVLVALLIVVASFISRPSLLVVAAVLFLLWSFAAQREEIRYGEYALSGRQKTLALAALSALLVFLVAGSVIFIVIGMCVTFVLAHAAFHTVSFSGAEGTEGATELEMQSVESV